MRPWEPANKPAMANQKQGRGSGRERQVSEVRERKVRGVLMKGILRERERENDAPTDS